MDTKILFGEHLLCKRTEDGKPLARKASSDCIEILCMTCLEYVPISRSIYSGKNPRLKCKQCENSYRQKIREAQKSGQPKKVKRVRLVKENLAQCCTCHEFKIQVIEGVPCKSRCNTCDSKRVTNRRKRFAAFIRSGGSKVCSQCGLEKCGTGDGGYTGGERVCKSCKTIRVRMLKYGLTKEKAIALTAQTMCDICGDEFKGIRGQHIDHCHRTGIVRGVLCASCNTGLGFFRDSPERLHSAAAYVNRQVYGHG